MAYLDHPTQSSSSSAASHYQYSQSPFQQHTMSHHHQSQYHHRQQHGRSGSSYSNQHLDTDYAREMPRSYLQESEQSSSSSSSSGNMAGFGARKFAQKQEVARRKAEQEQWAMEEERRRRQEEQYYQQQRIQREEYDRQQSRAYNDAQDEQRRQQEYQYWKAQQVERQREDERQEARSRAMAAAPSPQSRSIPLPGEMVRCSPPFHTQDLTPRPMATRSGTLETTASSEGAYLAYSSEGGRSNNHKASASTSSSSMTSKNTLLKPVQTPAMRETVYEDDYEEPAEAGVTMEADGFGGMKVVVRRESRCSQPEDIDSLPMAKCADCGDSLPFDELVGHSCINLSECKSPLFSQPPTPMLETNEGSRGNTRSPFLEKYSQLVDEGSSSYFNQVRSATSPALDSPDSSQPRTVHRSNTTPIPVETSASQRIEELRKERIKQIEEQRAAKKVQASNIDKTKLSASQTPPSWNQTTKTSPRMPFASHNHTREPRSISSSSVSSSKSSLFEMSQQLNSSQGGDYCSSSTGNVTPSSSFEQMDSPVERERRVKATVAAVEDSSTPKANRLAVNKSKAKIGKKPTLDLGSIENLMHDISTQDTPRAKPVKESTVNMMSSSSRRGPRPPELRLPTTKPRVKKTCHTCLQTFAKNQPMVEKDGKVFCIDDYAELYLEKCRKCCRPVRDVGVRSKDGALSGIYHRDCLSCFRCNEAFIDSTFYVFENAPYCGKHYHQLNGTTCQTCKEGIEGKCRQLETGERFHSRCLTCQFDNGKEFCKDTLTDYYLVKGKRLCEWHYERLQEYVAKKGTGAKELKASKRRTFVQKVEARKGKA